MDSQFSLPSFCLVASESQRAPALASQDIGSANLQLQTFDALYVPEPILEPPPLVPPSGLPPRKRRQPTEEQLHRKALRASNNRRFARESHERKQKYFSGLEKEVAALKKELEECKAKLVQYEMIERQKEIAEGKGYAKVADTFKEMTQKDADLPALSRKVTQDMNRINEEQRKVLELLSKWILKIAIPNCIRLVMWDAKNFGNIFDVESVRKSIGYKVTRQEARVRMEHLQAIYHDQKTYEEVQAKMGEISDTIRRNAKQFVECQRQMNIGALKMWRFIKERFMPQLEKSRSAARTMKAIPRVEGRPEFGDEPLLGIRDQDFQIDLEATLSSLEGKNNIHDPQDENGEEEEKKA